MRYYRHVDINWADGVGLCNADSLFNEARLDCGSENGRASLYTRRVKLGGTYCVSSVYEGIYHCVQRMYLRHMALQLQTPFAVL